MWTLPPQSSGGPRGGPQIIPGLIHAVKEIQQWPHWGLRSCILGGLGQSLRWGNPNTRVGSWEPVGGVPGVALVLSGGRGHTLGKGVGPSVGAGPGGGEKASPQLLPPPPRMRSGPSREAGRGRAADFLKLRLRPLGPQSTPSLGGRLCVDKQQIWFPGGAGEQPGPSSAPSPLLSSSLPRLPALPLPCQDAGQDPAGSLLSSPLTHAGQAPSRWQARDRSGCQAVCVSHYSSRWPQAGAALSPLFGWGH